MARAASIISEMEWGGTLSRWLGNLSDGRKHSKRHFLSTTYYYLLLTNTHYLPTPTELVVGYLLYRGVPNTLRSGLGRYAELCIGLVFWHPIPGLLPAIRDIAGPGGRFVLLTRFGCRPYSDSPQTTACCEPSRGAVHLWAATDRERIANSWENVKKNRRWQ